MQPDSNRWFTLRVPASSANLGPGFDALGLALGVYLTCRFRRSEALSIQRLRPRCRVASRHRPDNLIWQTALSVAQAHRMTMPPIELDIHNDIPIGKGMGSSAAALTAGVVIADHLLDLGWKPLRILDEAARLEGHPDNVAPCTLGSIVASAIDSGGVTRAVRLDLPQALRHRHRGPGFRPAHLQGARRAALRLQPRGRRLQRAARRAADRRAGHRLHLGLPRGA